MAPLYIKDAGTAELVAREAELDGMQRRESIKARLDALHPANPLPARTGPVADKAFFDEMWGETPG